MATTEQAPEFVDHDEMVMNRLSAVVLDYVEEHHGREAAERIAERAGKPLAQLRDLHGWTSYETYNRLWRAAVEVTGDPGIGTRIGASANRSRALEYLLNLGRTTGLLGNVGLGMRYLPDIINRSTRCVHYRAIDVVANHAVFEVREPLVGDFVRARCDYRRALFRSLPAINGLGWDQVTVDHPQCIGDGYPSCIYEVRWEQPARSLAMVWWLPLALAGAGLAFGLAWWAGASALSATAFAALSGVIVTFVGRGRTGAAKLQETVDTLRQQQELMIRAHDEVEARYLEQQEAYRALEAKTAELERTQAELVRTERLAAMGRLVAGLAHEINNPLAGILTSAELLSRTAEDPQVRHRAEAIVAEVERCRGLTRNMLSFGRQQPTSREPVDLAEVVDSALQLATHALRGGDVAVHVERGDGPTDVIGDRGQLQQVVLNLVENSVEALRERGADRRLEVAIAGTPEQVVVDVRDNGPGIPEAARDRLFEPFFTTRGVGRGTGLGLSICHGIVANHGGALALMPPREGGGAWFQLRLPREAELPELPDSERELAPAVSLSPARVYRWLVVDDEDLFRTSICRLLEQFGHRAVAAAGAAEARAVLEHDDDFDAILLDLTMPTEGGAELYRSWPAEVQRRVVFMTGELRRERDPAVEDVGEARLLIKPFSYRELMDTLAHLAPREGV